MPPPAASPRGMRAHRHSRLYSGFVTLMKVALPALAVVLVLLVVAWPRLKEERASFSLEFLANDGAFSATQRLDNARYFGLDGEGRPFSLTAQRAEETEPGSNIIRLESPSADLSLADGSWVLLSSLFGLFNQEEEELFLGGGVSLYHDGGYDLQTESATLYLEENRAVSTHPVAGRGPFGELTGEGFEIFDGGERIFLVGASRVVINLGEGAPPPPPPSPPDEESP